ncbi:interferon phi 4 isoform X2 [Misgurnus anguillicaudatus]|uniref:interferon phi 4 isoform X2 n=1 Tax=Misgurnus anguillicaudatus TaxID=75329 RepID=UPI002434B13B|nr:interferon phi 4 isoform X2 [Misgurnus anguillicaudatus]
MAGFHIGCSENAMCIICPVMSCMWIKHKYLQHQTVSLHLIEKMGERIIKGHIGINPIPHELLNNQKTAEPDKQLLFIIQTLEEIAGLFEDAESAPWDHKIIDDFLNIINEQINGLRSCGTFKMKRNKKLHLYFIRLRQMTEVKTEDSDKSWEIIRRRVISLLKQLEFFSLHTL